MLGAIALGGAILTGLGTLCSTARDMRSDGLISQKELAEIEAKSKAFEQFVNYNKNIVDKAFELEMKVLDFQKVLLDKILFLLEKVEKIENEDKLNIYYNQISSIQNTLNDSIKSDAKYFNGEMMNNSSVGMTDFHNKTQIGENQTSYENPKIGIKDIPKRPTDRIPMKQVKSLNYKG